MNMNKIDVLNKLIKQRNWVVWGVDPDNPKKPYDPKSLTSAKAGDPSTWGSFEQAFQRVTDGKAQGVGFQFNSDGFIGVDLDKCRNPSTGEIADWAKQIVKDFNSYAEISMSGTGLHIIIEGKKSNQRCKKTLNKKTGEAIEIYSESRYFIMTGDVYHNAPIADRTSELKALFSRLWTEEEPKQESTDNERDIEFLEIGLEKDQKLIAYYNGARPLGSESENDAGLMAKLLYWLNNNMDLAIEIFHASPYARQKDEAHKRKLDRHDYLPNLANAMKSERTAADDNEKWQQQSLKRKNSAESKENRTLNIISAPELQVAELPPIRFLVDEMLTEASINILAAPPKSGKSFWVLQLGLCIAGGKPFLERETKQAGVLYLTMEDGYNRLQNRMDKLLSGNPAPPWFNYSTDIIALDDGLLDCLDEHIKQFPETKFCVIDTFQKVRPSAQRGEMWYAQDYRETGSLKAFSQEKNLSILLVHHTIKSKSKDDPFGEIAGTSGITGAMDSMFVLQKPRKSKRATLHMTGRDIESDELIIVFNSVTCQWEFLGDAEEVAGQEMLFEYQTKPIVKTIKTLLEESSDNRWSGFAKNILEAGERIFKIPIAPSPQAVGKELAKLKSLLLEQDRIIYTISPNGNAGNRHNFCYAPEEDMSDDDNI